MVMQARRLQTCTQAAALSAADGHNSDEEVYAAAAAADEGAEANYDMNDNLLVHGGQKTVEPLQPIDHADIMYDDFNKDFYRESEASKALSPAEVRAHMRPC